jgi:uncharacterized protein (DUF927 family)
MRRRTTALDDSRRAHIEPIVAACAWLRHCRDDSATLPEPEWYAMLSIVGRCQGGENLAHEWSQDYPGYSEWETEKKLEHALTAAGPVTCARVEELTGGEWCQNCELRGMITSPIVIGNPDEVEKRESLELAERAVQAAEDEPTRIFDQEVIGALAVLKKEEPAEYARLKQELKGKVNLNDLERAVNKKVAEKQKVRLVEPNEPPPPLSEVLPNLPIELRKPYNWTINENGIWLSQGNKKEPVCACPVPVILTKRLRNIETSQEKVEIAFYRDQKWRHIMADRATVFNRTSLIQLTNKGLPVSSETARFLVKFLDDLERENLNNLPLIQSVSHMGWAGKNFLPGAEGDIVLDVDDDGASSVVSGYSSSGDFEEWIKAVQPVRENHPIARFMMSASFAAPLLKLVNQRVFVIHAWGASRGGKTAAAKAALSVWGDPDVLMANFNATKVGLERLAAFYSDLPLVIDEKQVVGDRQGFIESLVYMIGLGKGKTRGAKGGGIQAFSSWRTIAMTTGEEPLTTGSSRGGVSTRAIELYGLPISDESLAGRIHEQTKEHHGHAGVMFVRQMMETLAEDPEAFKTDFEVLKEELGKQAGDKSRSHLSAVATVILGDYYSSKWIFGIDEDESFAQAMSLAETILAQLEAAADMDDATRAREWIISWVEQHKSKFNDGTNERFGWVQYGTVYMLPTAFQKCMTEGGFSERRILRDFAERGWIQTEEEGGKVRYKPKRNFGNGWVRVVALRTEKWEQNGG